MAGPVVRGMVRVRTYRHLRNTGYSREDARDYVELLKDEMIELAVSTVAVEKTGTAAIGDGKIIDFINAHWEDILKIILALLGLSI